LPGKYKTTLYSCYLGLITQAININLLPLFFVIFHEQYGLSFEVLGRLVFLNFVTQIAVDVLAVRYADRIGYRASAVLAHVFSFLGIVCLGILPLIMSNTLLALTISVFIIGCGGGIIEVVISPIVESLPTKEKSASMSLLHSFFCWGTFYKNLLEAGMDAENAMRLTSEYMATLKSLTRQFGDSQG
jgi:MFS family permease